MLQHSPVLVLGIMDAKVYDRIFMYMISFRRVLETKKTHLKVLMHNKDAGLKEQYLIVSTTRDITEAVMINHI